MQKNQFNQQQDNLICTFVWIYQFNVSYGLRRASEYLGLSYASVSSRYYNVLRNEKKIFKQWFGGKEIWNTKRLSKDDLQDLRQYEPDIKPIEFEELENRKWWGGQ